MKKKNKTLVMFIGKTHSGKTTCAKELGKKVKDLVALEADPIAVFMKKEFPILRQNDDKKKYSGADNKNSLKFRTFLLFLDFALFLGKPILLSNANLYLNARKTIIKSCKKYGYKVIGVYFDFPEGILFERAKKSKRNKDVLRVVKDFKDLIIIQRERIEIPKTSEFDEFFVVKSSLEVQKLQKQLVKKLK